IRAPRRKPFFHGIAAPGRETFYPVDRADQLCDLPEASQNAKREYREDQPVQPAIGHEDRQDSSIGEPAAEQDQNQYGQHQQNLPDRLREMRMPRRAAATR